MKPYLNPNSGIEAFDPVATSIRIRFKGGKTYEYSSPPLAITHIERMKQLAEAGKGLNTYISQHRDVHDAGKLLP